MGRNTRFGSGLIGPEANTVSDLAANAGLADRHVSRQIRLAYADEGKSYPSVGGRASLTKLITDVEAGNADFNVILVFDVSRWGRLQDMDESAYYEHICRQAGIQVAYCAEQVENDGPSIASLLKSIKRAMAAEYSRELSD